MPPSKRAYLARRVRQADGGLRRSLVWLASIRITMIEQHPEIDPELLSLMGHIDGLRRSLLFFKQRTFGGSERDLWEASDLGTILTEAKPVTDPKAGK